MEDEVAPLFAIAGQIDKMLKDYDPIDARAPEVGVEEKVEVLDISDEKEVVETKKEKLLEDETPETEHSVDAAEVKGINTNCVLDDASHKSQGCTLEEKKTNDMDDEVSNFESSAPRILAVVEETRERTENDEKNNAAEETSETIEKDEKNNAAAEVEKVDEANLDDARGDDECVKDESTAQEILAEEEEKIEQRKEEIGETNKDRSKKEELGKVEKVAKEEISGELAQQVSDDCRDIKVTRIENETDELEDMDRISRVSSAPEVLNETKRKIEDSTVLNGNLDKKYKGIDRTDSEDTNMAENRLEHDIKLAVDLKQWEQVIKLAQQLLAMSESKTMKKIQENKNTKRKPVLLSFLSEGGDLSSHWKQTTKGRADTKYEKRKEVHRKRVREISPSPWEKMDVGMSTDASNPLLDGTPVTMKSREEILSMNAEELTKELESFKKGGATVESTRKIPALDLAKAKSLSVGKRLKYLQSYVSSFEYNFIGKEFFSPDKRWSLNRVIICAKNIIRDALPIKCLEATMLSIYLTSDMRDLTRIPLRFGTQAVGVTTYTYFHIVLAVRSRGKWGALGLSRRPDLGYKPLKYSSLSALVNDYKEAYRKIGHNIVRITIGLPIGNPKNAVEKMYYHFLIVPIKKHYTWSQIEKIIDLYATNMVNIAKALRQSGSLVGLSLNSNTILSKCSDLNHPALLYKPREDVDVSRLMSPTRNSSIRRRQKNLSMLSRPSSSSRSRQKKLSMLARPMSSRGSFYNKSTPNLPSFSRKQWSPPTFSRNRRSLSSSNLLQKRRALTPNPDRRRRHSKAIIYELPKDNDDDVPPENVNILAV